MIHLLALVLGTTDSLASAIIVTFGGIIVAFIGLFGIVIKNGRDVRIVRNRVTSNVDDERHKQNTQKFRNIESRLSAQNKQIIRIEDKLGIEHTIVPKRRTK